MPASMVMPKWGAGELRSGSGQKVPKSKAGQKQAIAIMYHERENEQQTGSPDRQKPTRKSK